MELKPFTGPGSTPSRRRFWDQVSDAVIASQKVAGRNVTTDEHPGKGTLINVERGPRAAVQTPGLGGLPMPTLFCDFRSVHLNKAATFPALKSVAACVGEFLTRTVTLTWSQNYTANDYPVPGTNLTITKSTNGTETVTQNTDGAVVSITRSGTTSVTRSDGAYSCSGTLADSTTCGSFYNTLYPANWYQSAFHDTETPGSTGFSCFGCTGGGGFTPDMCCAGSCPDRVFYTGDHLFCTSVHGGTYDGYSSGHCTFSDSGTVGFPASGGSWSNTYLWEVALTNPYTNAMFIQKAHDSMPAYLGNWRCRLDFLECREPPFPCTYRDYTSDDACGCVGNCNLFDDNLQISLSEFQYYFRINDGDPTPVTGVHLNWAERFTPDDGGADVDTEQTFVFDGTARETDIFESTLPSSNGTTIIAHVRWT